MDSWFSIFPRNKWLSIYVWIIFCLLPFFFIFRSSSPLEILIGITLMLLYFLSYMFSYKAKNGLVYMWVSFEIVINIVMTLLFGYVYLAIFTAFFIGNIRNPAGFYIIYGLHIAFTVGAIVAGFFIEIDLFLPQIHFILVSVLGTVLLPFNLYYRNKQINLEGQLEHANERISELVVLEERERISRDLHDILGQKLSLIGLKSDLAGKLIFRDPKTAEKELQDIRQTASTALREVRELVADIRAAKLENELVRAKQMLQAAEMELIIEGNPSFGQIPAIIESVLSMCLKEAVTNMVKHSRGTACRIKFEQLPNEYVLSVEDNGIGIVRGGKLEPGSGLRGMRERLEFVNGSLHVEGEEGTKLTIRVPVVLTHIMKEVD
ncbi:sensor histidine kinase [Siminovitchia fortis]|uniref:histidine kinase n=1 Tax=Siminovitchia fortis TaxID=254758 RepID=A0A443INU8_9BACI|nr:sensor histidine kinase [Siminovitchia fortis]RWR07840.1 sensor histidine kinase [Siminovitchia fortis]WHY80535.1 sensor histidine kinase [Siminovitchia fortis]